MKKIILGAIIITALACTTNTSEETVNPGKAPKKEITVMFYNTENFFDTENDPNKNDEEYLPESKLQWDSKKSHNKIKHISQVIDSIGAGNFPALVGMCEIENDFVVSELIEKSSLIGANYGHVTSNSPDDRSIDVSLMYDKDIFDFVESAEINATNASLGDYKTRNILKVKLKYNKTTDVYVFVNHWPSRREGEKESEPRRVYAAEQLRKSVDEILKVDAKAKIIIMGDFNDHPDNKSIQTTLKAMEKPKDGGSLYNAFFLIDKNRQGSHLFDNEWRSLDQIIISQGLWKDKKGLSFSEGSATVFKKDFILFKNNKTGEVKPNRTYGGEKYFNGYSDHLPIYIKLGTK